MGKSVEVAKLQRQVEMLQNKLTDTTYTLRTLITWLQLELGEENVKTLIGLLDGTDKTKS